MFLGFERALRRGVLSPNPALMEDAPRRLSRLQIAAGAGAILLVGGASWLWIERTPIATSLIDDAFRERGIQASYRLAQVGFRTQRIEDIRIGDPVNPDLVADWVEITLSLSPLGPSIRGIDAGGVKLRGRLVDGKLSLGAIDRLLPGTDPQQPFALPDVHLTARTMRFDVETPQGLVRATLKGKGNLHDDFRGQIGMNADRLVAGGCAAAAPRARLAVATDGGRPRLTGPIEAGEVDCSKATLTAPSLDFDARGNDDLTRWTGAVAVRKGRLAGRGFSAGRLGGELRFDGSIGRMAGETNIIAEQLRSGGASVAHAALVGRFRYAPAARSFGMAGDVRLSGVRLEATAADRLAAWFGAAEGTPVGPILSAWGNAIREASRNIDATARFAISDDPQGGVARLERAEARSESGGHLIIRAEQAEGLGWHWPNAGAVVNASVELSGGNFPELRMSVRQPAPGESLTGSATLAPYAFGQSRLRLTPVQFGPGPRGEARLTTHVTVDGPVADGRIDGLELPITAVVGANGSFAINNVCAPLRFERLVMAGTTIGRASLPLCPTDGALVGRSARGEFYGGARITMPRLRGRVGDQPLTMAVRALAISIGRPGFRLDDLAIRLGDPANPTRLDVVGLDGTVGRQGFGGRFEGAAGKIGAVPLLISEGAGDWRLAASVLSLNGAIRVADAEQASARFHPLQANDVRLTLKDGRIDTTGTLREPNSLAPVARVAIRHDLSSGAGNALLAVDQLRFALGGLQPEALTPLALGLVANVEGRVAGHGRIGWRDNDVLSDGEFSTEAINLAAAFGPVTGLKGTIRFTDLLGLVTAPDQQVTIVEINPGIAVTNGVIRYRILPDRKLAVAGGEWPFSGGILTLEPTTLDMANPVARRMAFRIAGLDAATFVQQLDFKNIAVTGKFDGVLPIIFDSRGGRIENGELKVRADGGTLSYVGDVTNADLGRMARIAFDALKSMRYNQLTIELNGDLDGEIVSKVRFDGTNAKPQDGGHGGGIVGRVLSPITRLPFRFTITITAPFRGLVNSAQTFVDPSIVLRNATSGALPVAGSETAPDQPPIQPR